MRTISVPLCRTTLRNIKHYTNIVSISEERIAAINVPVNLEENEEEYMFQSDPGDLRPIIFRNLTPIQLQLLYYLKPHSGLKPILKKENLHYTFYNLRVIMTKYNRQIIDKNETPAENTRY